MKSPPYFLVVVLVLPVAFQSRAVSGISRPWEAQIVSLANSSDSEKVAFVDSLHDDADWPAIADSVVAAGWWTDLRQAAEAVLSDVRMNSNEVRLRLALAIDVRDLVPCNGVETGFLCLPSDNGTAWNVRELDARFAAARITHFHWARSDPRRRRSLFRVANRLLKEPEMGYSGSVPEVDKVPLDVLVHYLDALYPRQHMEAWKQLHLGDPFGIPYKVFKRVGQYGSKIQL